MGICSVLGARLEGFQSAVRGDGEGVGFPMSRGTANGICSVGDRVGGLFSVRQGEVRQVSQR